MAEKSDSFAVVLAVDHSEFSEYAFKWYVKNLYIKHHVVHIVNVQCEKASRSIEKRRESFDHSKKVGENYLSWAEQNGIKDAKFASPQGDPWQEILKYAENVGAQVIVIGCRSQSSLHKSLTGSVSDAVLKHSPIPVLVCRARSD